MSDKDDICTDGKSHDPNWKAVTIEHDGDETYIDVPCTKCGRSGCVGSEKTLKEDISW